MCGGAAVLCVWRCALCKKEVERLLGSTPSKRFFFVFVSVVVSLCFGAGVEHWARRLLFFFWEWWT